jgi:hypothetical protein
MLTKSHARVVRAHGPPTDPPAGPVLVIDDDAAGSTTTLGWLPRLRVLVHTRHIAPADDAWALAAGGDAVLHKPGSAATLAREVRRLEGVAGTDTGTAAREPGSAGADNGGRP